MWEPRASAGVGTVAPVGVGVGSAPYVEGVDGAAVGGGRVVLVGMIGPIYVIAILVRGDPLVKVRLAARLKKRPAVVRPPLRSS